jgi:hypothetical protein
MRAVFGEMRIGEVAGPTRPEARKGGWLVGGKANNLTSCNGLRAAPDSRDPILHLGQNGGNHDEASITRLFCSPSFESYTLTAGDADYRGQLFIVIATWAVGPPYSN